MTVRPFGVQQMISNGEMMAVMKTKDTYAPFQVGVSSLASIESLIEHYQ